MIEINSIKTQIQQVKLSCSFTNYSLKSIESLINNDLVINENPQQNRNNHTIQRLQNIKFTSKIRLFIPFFFLICYGLQLIGAYNYRAFYYNNYKHSLLMTMNYIKFKKLFDSSILLGELIKTEHLIPSNPFQLINQTETIQLCLIYVDNSTNLFNTILDDLIVSDYFNQTMKNQILSAFRKDLCLSFQRFLIFCNTSQIKLPYIQNDSYLTITQDGIGGVIQNYKKIFQQEYSIERQTLKYSKDNTEFINSQIHQNFFIQYAQDIQSCFFTCFSYFINESIYLSDLFILAMSDYFTLTGIIILLLYIVFSVFWITYQYNQIHQIKYILILLEPKLLQKKGLHQILMRILNQI